MQTNTLKDRLKFFRFTDEDRAVAQSMWPAIKEALPSVLDGFYAHVKTVPHLAALVGNQQSRLVKAQMSHWEGLFASGPDEAYHERAVQIGLTHVRIGLDPSWYIGGYSFALTQLTETVLKKRFMSTGKRIRATQVMTKLVMLDMDVAISTYHEKMVADAVGRETELKAAIQEFQGVLGGTVGTLGAASEQLEVSSGSLRRETGSIGENYALVMPTKTSG